MKKYDQNEIPLLEALTGHSRSARGWFHVPGHGGGRGVPEALLDFTGPGVYSIDLTELPGLDDLNSPTGVIARAQELAAAAFGAERSFFLAGGTTQGLQALVLASGKPGDSIILPRNCHRSIIGGLILSGISPVFLRPAVVPGFNFPAGVPAGHYERAVAEHPGVCGAFCIHPTYYGTVGNTEKISRTVHAAALPLLADEAHGSHFCFHSGLPVGALAAGADAAAQSTHKTGGAMTQSSMLHLSRGALLDPERVSSALRLLQTSSPSYILLASLDAARRQLALKGFDLMDRLLEVAGSFREDLSQIHGMEVLGSEHIDGEGVFDFDPARVVVKTSGAGLTGWQAASWLAGNYGIYVEMADRDNIVMVLGPGASGGECRELALALRDLARREGGRPLSLSPGPGDFPSPVAVLGIREAWFSPARPVRTEEAAGLISGEWVAVYPPGMPVLFPGEEVSGAVVNYLIEARKSGARFQGPADPGLEYIRVMDI
ncbi:MAG: hypothetical protein JL50_06770 [Peptococcaceae bacterium BICA1-7]|nr:MAG: hypothetical protein JL50_06770 [Peptococcaceae bacterium BICA1-7]HBV99230.1 decarboxylase [Desulfotomaculum sp.]